MKILVTLLALAVPSLSFAADLDPTIGDAVTLGSASGAPSAAASGFVAWEDAGVIRVSRAGGTAIELGHGSSPVAAFNGSETAIAWIDGDGVQLARIDASGAVIDARRAGDWAGREETLALASNGGGWLLLRKANMQVIADRLAADGATISSVTLATFGEWENDPGTGSIAADGSAYLVLWHEVGEPRLARVTGSGVESLAAPMGFAARAAAGDAGFRLAMMGRTGTPSLIAHDLSEPQDVAVGAELTAPSIAYDGALFLVATEQRSKITGEPRLVSARLDGSGAPIDDPSRSLSVLAEDGSSAPSVASARDGRAIVAYLAAGEARVRTITRGDGVDDSIDNCAARGNADQRDSNENGIGDACEDVDADGVTDASDLCPTIADATNADADGDAVGNACDPDFVASESTEDESPEIDPQSGADADASDPQGGCNVVHGSITGAAGWLALLGLALVPFTRRR